MMKEKKVKKKSSGGESCHCLEFATSMEAWEKINELFLTHDKSLFDVNSAYNSGMSAVYNVFAKIRKAWVDPEFDYGRMFNYKEQKWTSLVNNYLDMNKLDLLRSKVRYFQEKYNQNYNLSYLFDNKHDNGKGCLLAATFSRRLGDDIPVITMMMRSSEITKRLIFDLLLIQRMGEYIYGSNQTFMINMVATQMYCNTETVLMYNTHKPIKGILKNCEDKDWVDTVYKSYDRFMNDPTSFKYKVFLRSAKCLNPKAFNHKSTPLLAKNLSIYDGSLDITFPENCITLTQRRNFLKSQIKKEKK
ncbi:MAG: hypothetical protein RSC49_02060 [Clostridium sp.]